MVTTKRGVKVAALVSAALILGAGVDTAQAGWRFSGNGTGGGGGSFSGRAGGNGAGTAGGVGSVRGGQPVNPAEVEALFESYATAVLGCTVDATSPTRGISLMAGGMSAEYSAAAAAGMVSYKANLTGPAGHVGGAVLAAAQKRSNTSTKLSASLGYVATYQLLSGQPMPATAAEAAAQFDAVFGAQARYGLSFQQSRDGSWSISGSGNTSGIPLEDGGTASQGYKVQLSIVAYDDGSGTVQSLVVHHSCFGNAAQWMY